MSRPYKPPVIRHDPSVAYGPDLEIELAPRYERVVWAIHHYRTRDAAAKALDISTKTLANYISEIAARIPGPGNPEIRIARWYAYRHGAST